MITEFFRCGCTHDLLPSSVPRGPTGHPRWKFWFQAVGPCPEAGMVLLDLLNGFYFQNMKRMMELFFLEGKNDRVKILVLQLASEATANGLSWTHIVRHASG